METSNTLEATTTTLEWKVTGLKKLFESSKGDVKSKVTRSLKFGGGQWQILFYPNSGTDGGAHLSLYLSCEPTAEEKEKASLDGKWVREGKYKFNFELCTIGKSTTFNRKEACDHSFNYKTANWGWAQFARRDAVYYNSSIVRQADAFLIHCEISCSPAVPHLAPQVPVQSVPKSLMISIGDLLDDPLYSDVEFVFPPKRKGKPTRRIYAMKALLTRADYFSGLLDSGFAEGKMQIEEEKETGDDADEEEGVTDAQTVQLASESPMSSSTYDSDFDDESNFDDDEQDDDAETTSASPEEVEMSVEERAVSSSVIEEEKEQPPSNSTEGVQDSKTEGDPDEETPVNGNPDLAVGWQSVNASNGSLPPSPDNIDSKQPINSEGRRSSDTLTTAPGPSKVKIVVSDVAYRTYRSMLHYLYTDNVVFAPLASTFSKEEDKRSSIANVPMPTTASSVVFEHSATTHGPKAPTSGSQTTIASRRDWLRLWHSNNQEALVGPCSAKAMYQLADKLNLLELKSRAFKHITKSMTVQNIPHEMFSSFSARFEEVRKVQVEYFLLHWGAIRSSDAMASIWQQIRGGKHPGFEEVWPRIAMNLIFKPQLSSPEDEDTEAI